MQHYGRSRRKIKIKQILALSALHDLTLIEAEQPVDSYRQIRATPPNEGDDLFTAGNKGGIQFQTLEKASLFLHSEYIQAFTAKLHSRYTDPNNGTEIKKKLRTKIIDAENNRSS